MSELRLWSRSLARPSHSEFFLTAMAPTDTGVTPAATSVFDALAERVSAGGLVPVQEQIRASADGRADVLAARETSYAAAGLEPHLPCAYTYGNPRHPSPFVAAQLWAVLPHQAQAVRVRTVEVPSGTSGRCLETPQLRLLWLPTICGVDRQGRLAQSADRQAALMFDNAAAALRVHGFSYRDVARTWIYLRRILEWYGEFNRVRTAFFRQQGIDGRAVQSAFPASTGIEGSRSDEQCTMDVLAFQPRADGVARRPLLRSSRQDPPFDYGSAFSRAMELDLNDRSTVLVSGTASIGPDGRTRYVDEPEAQVLETLLSIAALLETRQGSLRDIVAGTLFCKNDAARRAYEHVAHYLSLPELPLVPVMADVCRPELLVEIEAVALLDRALPSRPTR